MGNSYQENLKNSVIELYPAYLKKSILRQCVSEGLVINNKKNNRQIAITLDDIVDVTELDTIEEKINKILDEKSVLEFIDEFEFKKQYRHFCYFKCKNITVEKIQNLVKNGDIKFFKRDEISSPNDRYQKPVLHVVDNLFYFKFSSTLNNDVGKRINFSMVCVIDLEKKICEFRFDRIGIAYKNSFDFYKVEISKIQHYLIEKLEISFENIDFKAIIDYIKDKENISIYAQRLQRNGTTAYLEAYADDENGVIPILGELSNFIEGNNQLFSLDENTKRIKSELEKFIKEIEVKSDIPMVKVRMDDERIRFGITHDYKGTNYSLFMFYGELLGDKEMMDYVRNYLIECNRELEELIPAE